MSESDGGKLVRHRWRRTATARMRPHVIYVLENVHNVPDEDKDEVRALLSQALDSLAGAQ